MLLDLQNADAVKSQGLLFELDGKQADDRKREEELMQSVDRINRTFGKGTLFFGSQGIGQQWRGASDYCSPNYTLIGHFKKTATYHPAKYRKFKYFSRV